MSAVRALGVSRDFLQVLGYTPALGRGFVAAEHVPGGPRVALISHAMWRTHFGSAADVVGRTIRLNGEPSRSSACSLSRSPFRTRTAPLEVIVPLGLTVDPNDVAENWPTIARLREGVTREQAQADVASLTEPFRACVSEPGVRARTAG